jgi:hypothetical protein
MLGAFPPTRRCASVGGVMTAGENRKVSDWNLRATHYGTGTWEKLFARLQPIMDFIKKVPFSDRISMVLLPRISVAMRRDGTCCFGFLGF